MVSSYQALLGMPAPLNLLGSQALLGGVGQPQTAWMFDYSNLTQPLPILDPTLPSGSQSVHAMSPSQANPLSPNFDEAAPPLPWGMESATASEDPRNPLSRLAVANLQKRLTNKAAAKRIALGKSDPQDWLRTAARVPGGIFSALTRAAVSGATLPGDVLAGVPMTKEEEIARALDMTVLMGSATLGAPKGALGSGAVRPIAWLVRQLEDRGLRPNEKGINYALNSGLVSQDEHQALMTALNEAAGGKPGIPAIQFRGKVYTGDTHAIALYRVMNDLGPYPSVDMAIMEHPDLDQMTEANFGYVDSKGKFLTGNSDQYEINPTTGKVDIKMFAGGKGASVPALLAAGRKEPLYSTLDRVVANSPTKSASPQQWAATIKNAPGVKQEEVDWTGLSDMLANRQGPLSKEEMQAYLDQHRVQLGEVMKGEQPNWTREDSSRLDTLRGWSNLSDAEEAEFQDLVSRENTASDFPKFSRYQLPGGENYRELLLTMPKENPELAAVQNRIQEITMMPAAEHVRHGEALRTEFDMLRDKEFSLKQKMGANFTSPHWEEPNVLTHVRMNDRQIDGKPTLFLEELQSDWHQKGKREGYVTPEPRPYHITGQGKNWQVQWDDPQGGYSGGFGSKEEAEQAAVQRAVLTKQGVPDAPFKKTWPDLLLKRAVQKAVRNGQDQIAWTSGATQAARYDLSKQVSKISYNPKYGDLVAFDPDGTQVLVQHDVKPEKLADFIGKEAADKIVNKPTRVEGSKNKLNVLEGVDLQVGGEGMKAFYDQQLPRVANKLFGKYGAKVTESKMDARNYDGMGRLYKIQDEGGGVFSVHILQITPELKAAVEGDGLPLFSGGIVGLTAGAGGTALAQQLAKKAGVPGQVY